MDEKVLVASRSFGRIVDVGTKILEDNGLEIENVTDEDRPITEKFIKERLSKGNILAIVSSIEPLGSLTLQNVGNLKVISKHGVGLDNIDMDTATEKGIAVTNAPGTNTQAVADLTIGLMISLARSICLANRSTKSGNWERFIGSELWQKKIGVIGTGAIGKAVVKRLRGFNAEVLAYDVVEDEEFSSKYDVDYVSLDRLLVNSDFVTLHVPLTSQTKGLIGEEELKKMPTSSYLINAARGEVVNQEALFKALKNGEISGAALDAFAEEPPEERGLLDLDNSLATPHMGAHTVEAMERMDEICAENIVKVLNGEEPTNLANPEVFSA